MESQRQEMVNFLTAKVEGLLFGVLISIFIVGNFPVSIQYTQVINNNYNILC